MTDPLLQAQRRLPQYAEVIAEMAERDEAFRALCEDYALCLKASEAQKGGTPDARQGEFATLAAELEREILAAIAGYNRSRGGK